jgi:hypothetical protein
MNMKEDDLVSAVALVVEQAPENGDAAPPAADESEGAGPV